MKLSSRLLLLPAMISLLIACGEESNTLSNPSAKNNDAETTTSCQDKDYCVATQFLDEPVVGLNYECNSIAGVTDDDGVFLCPNNSVVSFFLKSASGNKKIELGKYRVKTLGSAVDGSPILKLNLIATPEDLVAQADGAAIDNKQLTNILRLLQALDSDGHSPNRVINRIVLDSKDKFAIDELATSVSLTQFATDDFDQVLKPMFDKLAPKSLANVGAAQAQARFNDSLISINAGIYEVTPTFIKESDNVYNGMFGRWTGSNLYSMVSMFFLVDRDGKTIGTALEWQKELSTENLNNSLVFNDFVVKTVPQDLFFNTNEPLFTPKGNVIPANFVLKNALGDVIKVTRGVLNKNNISSGEAAYRIAYGLTQVQAVDVSQLGAWQRNSATGISQISAGTLSLQKTRTPNMYLDGNFWRTKDNVVTGEKPIFPLHLKLTLKDSNTSTACSSTGCLVGDIGITILENGNIITDRNNDCSVVDSNTLKDAVNMQEQRLGFVASVLVDRTQSTTSESLIAPVMLVGDWAKQLPSSDLWYKIYGLHLGAISGMSGGPKVQIDIARATSGIVSIKNQQDEQEKLGEIALWANYINYLKYLSEPNTEKKKDIGYASLGAVTNIQTQACYNPQPKI
jgi:hypothetical protein